jgi:hypothetical protein
LMVVDEAGEEDELPQAARTRVRAAAAAARRRLLMWRSTLPHADWIGRCH